MDRFNDVLDRVREAALNRGYSLDQIDEQIITPSGLDDDAQAALWIVGAQTIAGRERYAARQALAFREAGDREAQIFGGD